MIQRIATKKLPMKCSECQSTIDEGDRYTIVHWDGGFDYRHTDCTVTSMKTHLREKAGG